nr:glutamate receptor ionotropic, delta-2-like [Lepeophtheirus salmonis]
MHYEYTVFTPSLDEIQSISILKDFFYLRIVKYTKDQFLVIKINPFLELNKLQTIDIWSLKTKQFIQNKSLLRTSYPTNFRGTVLKVAFMFSPPYVLEISGSPRIKTGLEYKIVSTIGESLNYKTNFTESVDCQWGSTDENGSWTGIIGMIERREADIGIGTITRTYDRAQAVDFSLGFVEQFLTFFAHVPQELPKWQAILWPFDVK